MVMHLSKLLTAVLALGLAASAHGDFKLPDCDAVGAWATGFSEEKRSQVTAAVRFSTQLRDDALVPVFGKPILEWGSPQFRDAGERLGECAKAADEGPDPTTRDRIQGLRRELMAAQTPVRRIAQSRLQVAKSVNTLLAVVSTPDRINTLNQALGALQGLDLRRAAGMIPKELHKAIADIIQYYPYLLPKDTETFGKRLLLRRSQLEAQIREAEIKALAELEEARAELDAAAASAEGIAVLDRLQRHPALKQAKPQDARAFIGELNAKRERIHAALRWQRQQAAEAELSTAKAELKALPLTSESLTELDRLARLPALRELPANGVHDFRVQLDHKRRAILDALARERAWRNTETLTTMRRELAELPLTDAGSSALDRLSRHSVLTEVSQDQARSFYRELQAKRSEITEARRRQKEAEAVRVADQALASLGNPEDDKLENLGAYRESAAQIARNMERDVGKAAAQRYWHGFKRHFAEQAELMLPQFQQALAAIPADREGLQHLHTAITDLSGVEDTRLLPLGYKQAIQQRAAEMVTRLQQQACEQRWKAMGVDSEDAAQTLWGAGDATTLGNFLCALMDAGHQVHGYRSPGLFSDTHSLELTLKPGGYQTLLLHQGEVEPDMEMLLGFRVSYANGERQLTLQAWEQYAAGLTPKQQPGDLCHRLLNTPVEKLSVSDNIAVLGCRLGAASAP